MPGHIKNLKTALCEPFPAFVVADYPHYTFRRASFASRSWRRRKLASWHKQSPRLWHFLGGLHVSTTSLRDIWQPPIGSRFSSSKGKDLPARSLARWPFFCHLTCFAARLPLKRSFPVPLCNQPCVLLISTSFRRSADFNETLDVRIAKPRRTRIAFVITTQLSIWDFLPRAVRRRLKQVPWP